MSINEVREMFADVVSPSVKVGSKTWGTVPFSALVHVLVIGAMVIIPLMANDVLPTPPQFFSYVTVVPPPPPPPPPPPRIAASAQQPAVDNSNVAPTEAPPVIAPESGIEPGFEKATIPGDGGLGTVPGTVELGLPEALPPTPPPVAPVRVGGNIKPPAKIKDASPQYPAIAQSARVQGIVIIEAVIGADGRVQDARILRSIPLLDDAALDAVRQWEYTPTLLNGLPVPVVMTVTVNFRLQ